jgi:tRNA A-37 threonylcarbamoyl transferase component Bud32
MDLGTGTVLLGRYRLDRQLGGGGMGTVWQATDLLLKRDVAVKLMAPQLRSDPVSWERFRREAQYQAALRHPGITEVYDYGEHEGQPFIVMEFLDGSDLSALLRGNPQGLPVAEAAALAVQAADALAYLHDSGLLHRDIKPANLFLGRDGQLKVCDFGVAKSVGSASITHAGARLGTWAYLAPEVWLGEQATARTDLYALGCVLHEMVTGQPPFSLLADEATVRQAHLRGQLPPPRGEQPLPERLSRLIGELLSKDPADRPATARDVADELRPVAAAPVAAVPGAGGPVADGLAPVPAPGRNLPPGADQPPGGNLPPGGSGGAAAATIQRTRELPPGYYQAGAGTAVLDGVRPGGVLADPGLAGLALADDPVLAASGQPRDADGTRLWAGAARVSAWLVFATMVALCIAIAAGHLAPEYRLFVLAPAALYTLPGAVAVSRATFSRAPSGRTASVGAMSVGAMSGGAMPGSAPSGGVGPAATVFVSLWISEAAAILVASHVRPAEAWSAVMVLSWLIGICAAVYSSNSFSARSLHPLLHQAPERG